MGCKTVLFLQSPPGRFATLLASELSQRNQSVLRINFCVGDWLQWSGGPSFNYRGTFDDWPSYLRAFIREHGVTHILYYGDRLPYHRVAMDVADELGIETIVYEFGDPDPTGSPWNVEG